MKEVDLKDPPQVESWQETFHSVEEAINYFNKRAKEYNYFYLLDKVKYVTLGKLMNDKQKENDNLNSNINVEKRIEYSFSLYCFCYDKRDHNRSCKYHVNFVLNYEDLDIDSEGITKSIYRRTSIKNDHNHELSIEKFQPAFNLMCFLGEKLHNFGSNSKINDVIDFAQKKYGLDLKYSQVYYLLEQLDPIHKYGDGADMIKFLLGKKNFLHYELDKDGKLDLLIYLSPFQKYLADKFGQVMYFDTICGTNKYNRVRGTISIQLNNGRIVSILHCLYQIKVQTHFKKFLK